MACLSGPVRGGVSLTSHHHGWAGSFCGGCPRRGTDDPERQFMARSLASLPCAPRSALSVRSIRDTEVPEWRVAIDPETVKRVRWHRYHVPRFRDDFDTVEGVDASSLLHDEHLPVRMAMFLRARARRIGSPRGGYRDSAIITTNVPSRRPRNGFG
jgi:hypothetical protein